MIALVRGYMGSNWPLFSRSPTIVRVPSKKKIKIKKNNLFTAVNHPWLHHQDRVCDELVSLNRNLRSRVSCGISSSPLVLMSETLPHQHETPSRASLQRPSSGHCLMVIVQVIFNLSLPSAANMRRSAKILILI